MIASSAREGGDHCPSFYPRGADRHSGAKNLNPGIKVHHRPSPEPLIDNESTAFLFAAMTWNVNLLEVLLAKAPNPFDRSASDPPVEDSTPIGAGAAFPSLEEALFPCAGATHRDRPTRSKRRKIGRCRGTRLPLTYHADPTQRVNDESVPVSDGIYLTEEEEAGAGQRTGCQPTNLAQQQCYPYAHPNPSNDDRKGNEGMQKEGDMSSGNSAEVRDNLSVTEKGGEASMRDFLRLFYQSFVLVMAAQVRHATCAKFPRDGQSLTPLESRALCFVQRHMHALKGILRQYVMCGDSESHRRGAQPLLLDVFGCKSTDLSNADWKPQHEQVYIAGRDPVYQPLLLDALGITRIVQCYTEHSNSGSYGLPLNTLSCWWRLLLEPTATQSEIFQSTDDWETGRALFSQTLTSLSWEPYSALGPYRTCTARLPLTGRHVVKLIVPAEDRATYDLSLHFQEDVFRFVHGSALFPIDAVPSAALVHCFAGRHRSSGIVVAYLLWLAAQSHGAVPSGRQREQRGPHPGHGPQPRYEPGGASYLRAARGNQSPVKNASAGVDMNEVTNVLQRCVAHVQRQRPMAVPIDTVQQQLAAYAAHLSLD